MSLYASFALYVVLRRIACRVVHSWKRVDIITLDTVRFQIVTSCPDLSRLLTMAEPIVPRPRNPIFSDVATIRFDQTVSDVAGNMSGMNCITSPPKCQTLSNLAIYNQTVVKEIITTNGIQYLSHVVNTRRIPQMLQTALPKTAFAYNRT